MVEKGEFERARAAATFNMFAEPRRTLIQSRISDLRFGPNTVSRHPPYHMIHISYLPAVSV